MSDRKESLLRTLKLQNEQLEQWEEKRTISRDPDEKKLCNIKIADIKELIAESEKELKKLGGGKQQQTQEDAVKPNVTHVGYNEIGFNADKKFSDNESGNTVSAINSLHELGDVYDPEEIKIGEGNVASIQSKGNSATYADKHHEGSTSTISKTAGKKNPAVATANASDDKKDSLRAKLSAFIFGLLVMAALCATLFIKDIEGITAGIFLKLGAGISAIAIIAAIYVLVKYKEGLKFALYVLVLCAYASAIFWNVVIIHKPEEKIVGEVVILPLIIITIGSILLLINEEYKDKRTGSTK